MRIQLILFFILFTVKTFANDDLAIQTLLKKYVSIVDEKKIELIDEVFTKSFLQDNGGKKEFIKKIKTLPAPLSAERSDIKWSKSKTKELYLVKLIKTEFSKSDNSTSEFTIIKEDGKFKIDGTLSDGN